MRIGRLLRAGVGRGREFEVGVSEAAWRELGRRANSASSPATAAGARHHAAVLRVSPGPVAPLAGPARRGHHRAAAERRQHRLRLPRPPLARRCASTLAMCSVRFFSRPRSEGWPHHGRRVILDSRLIWLYNLCLLMPPLSLDSGGFGKFGRILSPFISVLCHSG